MRIEGSVAPGFESVRALYERNMKTLAEDNTQLCVYHRGKKVVDLWCSTSDDDSFGPDSIVNIWSSGKSLEAIAVAALVGRGLLSYDDKIVKHWPEFGAEGKGEVSVADLMRHEAGLANFDTSLDPQDLLTENIKQNRVGSIIAAQKQNFRDPSGVRREYHAMTRGWIVNELFRRVDPAGRTIGEFLREEISEPLQVDTVIGVREEELPRVSSLRFLGMGFQIFQTLVPKFLGRKVIHNFWTLLRRLLVIIPLILRNRKAAAPPPAFTDMGGLDIFNEPRVSMGETPSANAHSSARGLAKIAALLSGGGKLDGGKCLNEQAMAAMHAAPTAAVMGGMIPTHFTQGGVADFVPCSAGSNRLERDFNEGREGFYGWMGFGGSIFQWHPKLDIGFGFVPTALHYLDFLNERGKVYQAEVLRCVARLEPGGN